MHKMGQQAKTAAGGQKSKAWYTRERRQNSGARLMFRYPLGPHAELRLLELRHAEEMFALIDQNREYLRRWLTWVDDTRAVSDSRNFIRNTLQQFAENRGFS